MSETKFKALTANRLADDFKAIYNEQLIEQVSDIDLTSVLIDQGFFTIREAKDQELFFATSAHLDTFLAASVPATVAFNEERLGLWAREALEFARRNVKHSSFTDVFSSRTQYDTLIQGMVLLNDKGTYILEYFRQLRIDSVFIADNLPAQFLALVHNAAREAVRPALVSLSHHLMTHERIGKPRGGRGLEYVRTVKGTPSFLDRKGVIQFTESAGQFSLVKAKELENIKRNQPVIDRAIRKLAEARVAQRIGNRDRILTGLLSEYKDEILRGPKSLRVPILWTLGIEIDERISVQERIASEEDRLDDSDLLDLRRLILAHNIYIGCFDQTASLLTDIEASAAIYQKAGNAARNLPGLILRQAIDDDLLEADTASTIARAVSPSPSEGVETKGTIALRLGLLRGLLHATGSHILNGIQKVLEKAAIDVTSKGLIELLRTDSSLTLVFSFLQAQALYLIQLSEKVPLYFGYVRQILKLIGI